MKPRAVPPASPGHNLRFQVVAWLFFFLIDVVMLSTFETVTWRKAFNVFIGLTACGLISQLIWIAANRADLLARPLRSLPLVVVACLAGGAAIGAAMQPLEHWAKDPALVGSSLPAAEFSGLWVFYSLMLTLWSVLAAAFIFYDRARRAELQRAEFAAAAREAELNPVRLQVNPHFLFNSFATLRALVEVDPARARDAINHLSGMMRYALQSAGDRTVPLREELAVVRAYLKLEQLRLADRLRVTESDATELEGFRVPPMSLQTLVENAVKFGVANRREGGDVTIEITREGPMLRMKVENPGSIKSPSDSTGIGLSNVRTRLELLYGTNGDVALVQAAPDRVRCTLTLPVSNKSA